MPLDETPTWRARRRQKILEAAADLFARLPYRDVQVDDVARAAGVGKPTLYRYFPSKEDLYLEVFDQALIVLDRRLRVPAGQGATPPDALAHMMRTLVDTFAEYLPVLMALGDDPARLAERVREVLRRRTLCIAESLRDALEAGIASGHFRPVDLTVTPAMLIGMIRGAVMGAGDQPRARLIDALLDLILKGGLTATPVARETTS